MQTNWLITDFCLSNGNQWKQTAAQWAKNWDLQGITESQNGRVGWDSWRSDLPAQAESSRIFNRNNSTNNSEWWIYLKKVKYTSIVHDKEKKNYLFAQQYFYITTEEIFQIKYICCWKEIYLKKVVNDENFRDTTKFDQAAHKFSRVTKSNSLEDTLKNIIWNWKIWKQDKNYFLVA